MWAKTSPSFELYCLCVCCAAEDPPLGCSHTLHSWKIINPSASHCLTPGKWGVLGGTDTHDAGAGRGQHLHLPVPPHGDRGKVSLCTATIAPPVPGVDALSAPEQIFGAGGDQPPLEVSGRRWDESGGSHTGTEPLKPKTSVALCVRAEGQSPTGIHVPCPQVRPMAPARAPQHHPCA